MNTLSLGLSGVRVNLSLIIKLWLLMFPPEGFKLIEIIEVTNAKIMEFFKVVSWGPYHIFYFNYLRSWSENKKFLTKYLLHLMLSTLHMVKYLIILTSTIAFPWNLTILYKFFNRSQQLHVLISFPLIWRPSPGSKGWDINISHAPLERERERNRDEDIPIYLEILI